MIKEENLGKCVTDNAVRKIEFKKNPKTGKISKVIKVTHVQKCSQDKELVALEGKEEENNLLDDELTEEESEEENNVSDKAQDESGEENEEEMRVIREGFRRYLRGALK